MLPIILLNFLLILLALINFCDIRYDLKPIISVILTLCTAVSNFIPKILHSSMQVHVKTPVQ